MTARLTATEARALLHGTTPGPWKERLYEGNDLADPEGAPWFDVSSEAYDVMPFVCGVYTDRTTAHDLGHDPRLLAGSDAALIAAAPDLAATVIALTEERDAIAADREALAMGVWSAVHGDGAMPPLDTPRDRAEVIAAVEGLRRERDEARTHERAASERARILRGTVRHVEEERDVARLLAQRARDDRHEAERRAILAEQARTEAVRERDEARAEVERLRAIAYIGEHRFPDLTWRARCEETIADLRAARAEVERLRERAERDEAALRVVALWLGGPHHPSQPSDVEELARKVGAEMERRRSIVEGRTTPPTDEEIAAIVAEGGWWQCGTDDGGWGVSICADHYDVRNVLRDAAAEGVMLRWWAHDRTGRPCAWPTVGGAQ